jgi:hypothetical protein
MTIDELNHIKFAKRKKAKDYLDETFTISHLRLKEDEYAQLYGKEAKVIGFFINEKYFFLKVEVNTTTNKEYYFAWDFATENAYLVAQEDKYYKMSANSGVHNFFIHTLAQINLLKIAQEKANDKKHDKHPHPDKIEKTEKEKKDKEKDKEKEKKHRGRPSKNEEARKSRMELRMTKDEKKIIKDYLEKYNAKHQSQLSVTDLLVKLCSEEV